MKEIKISGKTFSPEEIITLGSAVGIFLSMLPMSAFIKHSEINLLLLYIALGSFVFLTTFSILIIAIVKSFNKKAVNATNNILLTLALLAIISIFVFLLINWQIVVKETGWLFSALVFISAYLVKEMFPEKYYVNKTVGNWSALSLLVIIFCMLPSLWQETKVGFWFSLVAAILMGIMLWTNGLKAYIKWIKKLL